MSSGPLFSCKSSAEVWHRCPERSRKRERARTRKYLKRKDTKTQRHEGSTKGREGMAATGSGSGWKPPMALPAARIGLPACSLCLDAARGRFVAGDWDAARTSRRQRRCHPPVNGGPGGFSSRLKPAGDPRAAPCSEGRVPPMGSGLLDDRRWYRLVWSGECQGPVRAPLPTLTPISRTVFLSWLKGLLSTCSRLLQRPLQAPKALFLGARASPPPRPQPAGAILRAH
jgi:hypothetical protein